MQRSAPPARTAEAASPRSFDAALRWGVVAEEAAGSLRSGRARGRPGPRLRRRTLALIGVGLAVGPAAGAAAAPPADVIVLPGATSAEGIAVGPGATFYAGDLFRGDVYRGDLQRGTAARFITAPAGRMALGLKVDVPSGLLFVAGGFTGQAYVYDAATGATRATYQLADPATGPTVVNDVVVTRDGAWFTDSARPRLSLVPLGPGGRLGPARTLALTGPAADTSAEFNLNGIAATPDGSTLVVAHSGAGRLYTVDPATGASAAVAGVAVPNVDGILLEAGRLWAVQNFSNQIAVVRLSSDLSSGAVERVITSPAFQVPATAARHGGRLAVVNAKFDTGLPPTAPRYEVVVVDG
jgi:sugar lactone lactonase YvrE